MEPSGFEGRGGALVEEAKKLMQDDDDGPPAGEQSNAGPKIKMNKIGRKSKKPTAGAATTGASRGGVAANIDMDYKPAKGQGPFTE